MRLLQEICRPAARGYRAYYRCASQLFHDLTLARADGTYIRLLADRLLHNTHRIVLKDPSRRKEAKLDA